MPAHLPLHCLVCCEWPGPAKCHPSGFKDHQPDCLLRPPDCAYQNRESVAQSSHPCTLDTVHWTPGRFIGRGSPKPGHELMVSLELSKKMKGALLPRRAQALDSTQTWIQIKPCSTIHWLHGHKQALNLSSLDSPICNARVLIPTQDLRGLCKITYIQHLGQHMSQKSTRYMVIGIAPSKGSLVGHLNLSFMGAKGRSCQDIG